ncbi:MAG: hypothetical protein ABI451_02225 [Dokdonella sp.]
MKVELFLLRGLFVLMTAATVFGVSDLLRGTPSVTPHLTQSSSAASNNAG